MAKKKPKNNPWAICTASVGRDNKEKYERCVMSVKKQVGHESVDPDVKKIAEALEDLDNAGADAPSDLPDFGAMGDEPEALPAPAPGGEETPAEGGEQWVIMCHGQEEGEKVTEVWGPYASKDEAVADLRDCIKDEFGDEKLASVEGQLGSGHVEVDGWTKAVVPLKSPDAPEESEAPVAPEMPEAEGEDAPEPAPEAEGDEDKPGY